jgi:hypothetical protein
VRAAPLRYRLLATLIDTLVGSAALAFVIAAGALVFKLLGERGVRRLLGGAQGTRSPSAEALQSRRARFLLGVIGVIASAPGGAGRSPGDRVLGLRRVDARSGREPSARQRQISAGVRGLWAIVCKEALPPPRARPAIDQTQLQAELEQARREHEGDPAALEAALRRIHSERGIRPAAACLPALVRPLAATAIDLPVYSGLHQSLPDRLAGVVVIRERRPRR